MMKLTHYQKVLCCDNIRIKIIIDKINYFYSYIEIN